MRSNCAKWFSHCGAASAQQGEINRHEREIATKQATIDKLSHEMAALKRLKFAAKSQAFNAEQRSLLEETIDSDLAALSQELQRIVPKVSAGAREAATRAPGAGQDVAGKLDHQPGVFTVQRHIRGNGSVPSARPSFRRRSGSMRCCVKRQPCEAPAVVASRTHTW
ncbi:MAG: transposase [Burkholderiaceae bacterium]